MKRGYLFLLGVVLVLLVGCSQEEIIEGEHLHEEGTPEDHAHDDDSMEQGNEMTDDDFEVVNSVKEINVRAFKWDFEPNIITVNEGDNVKLIIDSEDVKHGIRISEYDIREDLNPGEITTIEFVADKKGTFSFFCDVFCGSGHSHMSGKLIVE